MVRCEHRTGAGPRIGRASVAPPTPSRLRSSCARRGTRRGPSCGSARPDRLSGAAARLGAPAGHRRRDPRPPGRDHRGGDGLGEDHPDPEDRARARPGSGRSDRSHPAAADRRTHRRGADRRRARHDARRGRRLPGALHRHVRRRHPGQGHDGRHPARADPARPDAARVRHADHRRGPRAFPQHRLHPGLPDPAAPPPSGPQGHHHVGDDRLRAVRRPLRQSAGRGGSGRPAGPAEPGESRRHTRARHRGHGQDLPGRRPLPPARPRPPAARGGHAGPGLRGVGAEPFVRAERSRRDPRARSGRSLRSTRRGRAPRRGAGRAHRDLRSRRRAVRGRPRRHPGLPRGRAGHPGHRGRTRRPPGTPRRRSRTGRPGGRRGDPAALRAAVVGRPAPGVRAARHPSRRACDQRGRDVAHGPGDPVRDRPGNGPDLALLEGHQGAAAPDRADLPGLREPALRPVRARGRRHRDPPVLRVGLRLASGVHRTRDPADVARVRDPADGRGRRRVLAGRRRAVPVRGPARHPRDPRRGAAAHRARRPRHGRHGRHGRAPTHRSAAGRRRPRSADRCRSRPRAAPDGSPARSDDRRGWPTRRRARGHHHRRRALDPGPARAPHRAATAGRPGARALQRPDVGLPQLPQPLGVREGAAARALRKRVPPPVQGRVPQLPAAARVAGRRHAAARDGEAARHHGATADGPRDRVGRAGIGHGPSLGPGRGGLHRRAGRRRDDTRRGHHDRRGGTTRAGGAPGR